MTQTAAPPAPHPATGSHLHGATHAPAWRAPDRHLHLLDPHGAPLTAAQARHALHGAPRGTHLLGAIGFTPQDPAAFHLAHSTPPTSTSPTSTAALSTAASTGTPVLHAASRPAPDAFEANVAHAAAAIARGDLHKVVLGRTLDLHLHAAPDPSAVTARLAQGAPDAFVFSVPLGDGAQLVGASPERLLSKRGAQLRLRPLAGTRARHADPAEDLRRAHDLLHSAKDRHEHALMIAAIRETLAPLCRELTVPDAPRLVQTPGLWHLGTSIHATLRDPGLHVLDLVSAVHPTPAVCGVPAPAARDLIGTLEGPRGSFAGAVGWCDARGDGEWAVTIRCARLRGPHARLFAGAGIVAGSDPAQERAETAAKFGTMLRALGVSPLDLEGAL
ncbi:isochorismate synthase [Deinococcus sedimenti]|uniref:isochorismate synthase n=1 Tax=Deinococcus sedimenti TaxID=1867090 RepID=A0ABQ2SBX0_9DEIO|nr:isochorismate synthase [Deinococcus sedimenti]GGS09568.1 isochorismate synthase EntC [Deinococcus sedimenti]